MTPGGSPAPRAVGIALILLGVGAAATSMGISLDQYGRWGARVFPLAGSLSLIAVGAAELWGARKAAPLDHRHVPAIFALLLVSFVYVWTLSAFGYLISTALAAPVVLWIFGVRHPMGLGAAAVLCPLAYHAIFFELLGVFPPLGRWFDLLDVLGGY
ncbi:tripartite tricarboxylate transporter TctB family protein [Roseobacter sp. YSTF-M11]|uniref:Tripartite tricarboxylate transporter TctB family protein n=1 Tax=Roseobacter insulae TaxID=2859783 RepID=A0A9X1FW72_9RHOB|nr:tripartite tricarboxylate transporter TctB family protein [Roseobacter insulae]MBW4709190.1 tripartite tricarboxylate transporter TctB family protein [Roseobacter insulae]